MLKKLIINRLGPTAVLAKNPTTRALQASDALFLVDEEIVTSAQEFVFV